jgi:hypothetical protein
MPNSHNPILDFRAEVQTYLRASEHLVAAASTAPPFSKEERAIIQYYVAEVGKILAVSPQT